jgi:hypothetical protein
VSTHVARKSVEKIGCLSSKSLYPRLPCRLYQYFIGSHKLVHTDLFYDFASVNGTPKERQREVSSSWP